MNILKFEKPILTAVIIALVVGITTIVTVVSIYFFKGYINQGEIDSGLFGTFGDFIGGFVGTIFTIAATLLILLTYQSQKVELQATNKIATLQSQTQKQQNFESTFFNLLKFIDGTRSNLNFTIYHSNSSQYSIRNLITSEEPPQKEIYKGVDSFVFYFNDFKENYTKVDKKIHINEKINLTGSLSAMLEIHNIKSFYDLINVTYEVVAQDVKVNQEFYYSLLYAQFSKYEKLILFYLGVSGIYPSLSNIFKDRNEFIKFEYELYLIDKEHLKYYKL